MTWYDYNNNGSPLTPTQFDREIITLCGPNGSIVLVQDVTSVEAPLGTAPTILAWNLDSTPYTGVIAELKKCESLNDVQIEKDDYCANGLNVTKVTGLSSKDGTVLWTVWLNDAGNIIQSPTLPMHSVYGGSYGQPLTTDDVIVLEKGLCKIVEPVLNLNKKTYLSENTGILTLASIIALMPANSIIESITVSQVIGTGSISGDTGTGLTMETGRTDSFNVEDFGNFNTSSMSMNAGVGGRQRISIIYSN